MRARILMAALLVTGCDPVTGQVSSGEGKVCADAGAGHGELACGLGECQTDRVEPLQRTGEIVVRGEGVRQMTRVGAVAYHDACEAAHGCATGQPHGFSADDCAAFAQICTEYLLDVNLAAPPATTVSVLTEAAGDACLEPEACALRTFHASFRWGDCSTDFERLLCSVLDFDVVVPRRPDVDENAWLGRIAALIDDRCLEPMGLEDAGGEWLDYKIVGLTTAGQEALVTCIAGVVLEETTWTHLDADGDGRGPICDTCPEAADEEGGDTDGDGQGDACDDDDDGDGLPDEAEAEQGTDPLDPDTDGDGVDDGEDVCPLVRDPEQAVQGGLGVACSTPLHAAPSASGVHPGLDRLVWTDWHFPGFDELWRIDDESFLAEGLNPGAMEGTDEGGGGGPMRRPVADDFKSVLQALARPDDRGDDETIVGRVIGYSDHDWYASQYCWSQTGARCVEQARVPKVSYVPGNAGLAVVGGQYTVLPCYCPPEPDADGEVQPPMSRFWLTHPAHDVEPVATGDAIDGQRLLDPEQVERDRPYQARYRAFQIEWAAEVWMATVYLWGETMRPEWSKPRVLAELTRGYAYQDGVRRLSPARKQVGADVVQRGVSLRGAGAAVVYHAPRLDQRTRDLIEEAGMAGGEHRIWPEELAAEITAQSHMEPTSALIALESPYWDGFPSRGGLDDLDEHARVGAPADAPAGCRSPVWFVVYEDGEFGLEVTCAGHRCDQLLRRADDVPEVCREERRRWRTNPMPVFARPVMDPKFLGGPPRDAGQRLRSYRSFFGVELLGVDLGLDLSEMGLDLSRFRDDYRALAACGTPIRRGVAALHERDQVDVIRRREAVYAGFDVVVNLSAFFGLGCGVDRNPIRVRLGDDVVDAMPLKERQRWSR